MAQSATSVRLNGTGPIDPRDATHSVLRNLCVEAVTIPEPTVGEVLVEPLCVGVCGSDISASLGKPNFSWVARPRTIGHECSGRIVAFGPGTEPMTDLKVGDVICCIPMRGCGRAECRGCRRGRPNYCRQKAILGFHRDGALANRMVVDVQQCMKLRDGLSPLQGAVVEPLSVVAQGIHRKCGIRPGQDVVVSGCGIIGLMAAELARAAGARVAVTGVAQDRHVRLALAKDRGFIPIVVGPDQTLEGQLKSGLVDLQGGRFGDAYENGTVDLLIECSGALTALGNAGLSVQLEGSILVIATFGSEVPFNATAFTRSGQKMAGVMGSNREDCEVAQTLLQQGVFPVEAYSELYAFDDVLRAMEDSMRAKTTKAIVRVN